MTLATLSKSFPSKKVLLETIEQRKKHLKNLSSFMWYIMPVAECLGDQVYKVAARLLCESGLDVNADQLGQLADDINSPARKEFYGKERLFHIGTNLTGVKDVLRPGDSQSDQA
jgi:hypothetical protein